jgi:long-chain acyl-CoA synthetase
LEDKLNSLPCVVESVVVDRDHKLVTLVYPDTSADGKKFLGNKSLTQQMEENRVAANKDLPAYSQISSIELVASEFEKTPKRSIKRYLYK